MANPRTTLDATSLAPAEAIAFLRQKANVTSQHWHDVWNEAHSRSFVVAGAASEALVGDFRTAVAKALEQGTTLAEFRRDFDAIVAKHGWVHNGSAAWRSQIIYETNLSVAYSAGRYAQMTEPDTLRVYPYWQYMHTSSARPRPQHLAWVGTTLRADDPWWGTHYPPNGWRCRCSVRPVSEAGLGRQGKRGPDAAPAVDLRPWKNPRTGEIIQVPHGIDPGFGYNPGEAWADHTLPPREVGPPLPGAPRPPRTPRIPPAEAVDPLPLPVATPEEIVRFIENPAGRAVVGEIGAESAAVMAPEGARAAPTVRIFAETMEKQLYRHPDLTQADYVGLRRHLAAPDLVVEINPARHVLFVRETERYALAAVVKRTRANEFVLVSLYRMRRSDVARHLRRHRLLLGNLAALGLVSGAPEGPPANPS